MQPAEAARLVGRLKAAYPRMTLDEPETELLVREVALLSDALVLNDAVDRIIRNEERFPPIAMIRSYYRLANESRRRPALPEGGERAADIPEWAHVWFWQLTRTRTERQAQNETSRAPVDERPPAKMRDFPQFEHPAADAYSTDEYKAIRTEWLTAGSPRAGNVEQIVGAAA